MGYKAKNKQNDPPRLSEANRISEVKVGKKKARYIAEGKKVTKKTGASISSGATKGSSKGKDPKAQKAQKPKERKVVEFNESDVELSDLEEDDDTGALSAARQALFGDDDLEPEQDDDVDEFEGLSGEDELADSADSAESEGDDVSGDESASESEQDGSDSDGSADSFHSVSDGETAAQPDIDVDDLLSDNDDDEGSLDDSLLEENASDSASETSENALDTEEAVTDLRQIDRRMKQTAMYLSNWKKHSEKTELSRSDLMARFVRDVQMYFGYNEFLAEKLVDIFGVEEALEFFTASDTPRPVTIRVNTLKARRKDVAQALINRGVNVEPVEHLKVGLQVFSSGSNHVPVGATPEYLSGHYLLQAASSFLPVIALNPEPGMKVLDMSSAPGGKTTHMAALMGNTGQVWANDSSKSRLKALNSNVTRLGCRNVIVTNVDGREFPKLMGGFDRVLLDAPCSGTGVISKDASVKTNKSERDFMLLSHLQKQLILCAIDSTKAGGYVVYSTCSVTVDEDEAVVHYALHKRPHVKLVETGLSFGKEGFKRYRGKVFDPSLALTRRFYPHVHNMDGFYVAKIYVGKKEKVKETVDDEPEEAYEPLALDDAEEVSEGEKFDSDEDAELIEKTLKRHLKKKGIDPRSLKKQRST